MAPPTTAAGSAQHTPSVAGADAAPQILETNSSVAPPPADAVDGDAAEADAEALAAPTSPSMMGIKRKSPDAAARPNGLRGRSFLNHQQRLEIIKKKDEEPKWTQVQLARWAAVHFGLPKEPSQATIAVLLKKREQLKAATVRPQTRTIRSPRHPELEAALLLWVRYLQTKGVPFTGENIRLKASALASQLGIATTLNFSTGWMSGFVSRHSLLLARAHKKKHTDADDEPLRSVLKNYDPRNVFALHEVALIYNDLPFDGDLQERANPDRDRVCVGLAVNADSSEKLEPLVVTTCRRKLGVFTETFYNVDGNMTARIFEQWMYKLNQRMIAIQRKIVVVVNAVPSHFPIQLSHVRLVVLPQKNGQRHAHPLEGNVTKNFKALYRRTHLSFALDQSEEGHARIFDVGIVRALLWIKQAWLDVPPELIRNNWVRTGFIAARDPVSDADNMDVAPEIMQSLAVGLTHLQLIETLPMGKLINSPIEEEAHYIYDDATIMRVVAGDVLHEGDADADVDGKPSVDDDPTRLRRVADDDAFSTPFVPKEYFEKEPTTEELLANYRGVIWSLDGEVPRSAEHQVVLRFLRQKQAALRQRLQQSQRPVPPPPPPSTADTQTLVV